MDFVDDLEKEFMGCVIDHEVIDGDTGKDITDLIDDPISRSYFPSRDKAEAFIRGRISVKNTNTLENYYIRECDARGKTGKIVCVWRVTPYRRRDDGNFTIFIRIITDDFVGYIP